MNHPHAVRRVPVLVSLALAAMFCAWSPSTRAEPDQLPLTTRSAPPPAPNVMMTIDDSGSMLSDAMPEQWFTVNGQTVGLITNYWVGAFPNDPRKNGTYQGCTVPAVKTANDFVYQAQFRSPQVNSIWYDPNIRYRPWVSTDGVNRMANSDPANAMWDPIIGTAKNNIFNKRTGVNVTWCTTSSSYDNVSRDFYPGLYYILKDGADPTLISSYVRYDVGTS